MKRFKIIIFSFICFTILSGGIAFCEPPVSDPVSSQVTSETIPETIPEKNAENLKKIKDSTQTSHLFGYLKIITVAGLFLLIMFGLYKLYSKIKNKEYIVEAPPSETLATPTDFKSAINLFLGKTDE